MMDSIRKASQQRTLIVYTLLFSLCSTGRCFQVFVFSFSSSIFFERSHSLFVARVENQLNAFSQALAGNLIRKIAAQSID